MSSRQEELRARIDNAIARQQLIVASQESAASAAGRAEGYMNKAADWAAKAHGQVVEDDKYSALHYAEEAAASVVEAGEAVEDASQSAAAATASAVLASEWASKTDGHVEGTEDSAKQHALNAAATEASVLDTYAKVADTYEDAVEAARLSAQASADAQEHAHNAAVSSVSAAGSASTASSQAEEAITQAGVAINSAAAASSSADRAQYAAMNIATAPETQLPSDNVLRAGHRYLLSITTDVSLSALIVEQYGACELWIDYTAGSVDLTGTGWVWVPDGAVLAKFTAGKRYCIALRNDGTATLANLQYEYTIHAQS